METKCAYEQLVADSKLGLDEPQRKELYKDRHKDLSVAELAARMKVVEELDDYLENLGKYLHAEYDTIRMVLLPEAMDREHLESPVNVSGVGSVRLTSDLFVSVGSDNRDRFFDWLRDHNMGGLITETINPSTLKAWVKGRIKDGKEWPQDLLKVTPFTRASITKVK